MRTVKSLIAELQKFPMAALCYAYEGEITGVVVMDKNDRQLGYIACSEGEKNEDSTPADKT